MTRRNNHPVARMLLLGILSLLVLNIAAPVIARPTENLVPENDGRDKQAVENSMRFSLDFPMPDVKSSGNGEISLSGDGWISASPPGTFNIPSWTVNVLLPSGTEVADIDIVWGYPTVISSSIPLETAPFITYPGGPLLYPKDGYGETYGIRDYRRPTIQNVGVQYFRGFAITSLIVDPICYEPDTDELRLYSGAELNLNLRDSSAYDNIAMVRRGPMGLIDTEELLQRNLVITEPSIDFTLDSYNFASMARERSIPQGGEYYPYVIITSAAMYDHFLPLAQWKINKGIPTKIVDLADITSDADYDDVDTPAEIRNFVADAYQNWNTEYVLIGGDTDVVPFRGLYGLVSGVCEDDNIPVDHYYGSLDGPYNNDGDGRWGESNDGTAGGDVDHVSEVYIGRAPVSTTTQADTFVNKILDYERDPRTGFVQKALLSAAWLDDNTDASLSADDLESQTFPPQMTTIKLYETLGNATKNNFNTAMNDGVNLVYNGGHANYNVMSLTETLAYYRGDADAHVSDHRYNLFYTMGCYANAFDYSDAISEHLMFNANGGSVVFIGNTRYGLYSPGNMLASPSHKFAREFFDKLFNGGVREAGKANKLGMEDLAGFNHLGYMRWVYYTVNYMGDPTMNIWFNEPEPLTVTHPAMTYTDSAAPFSVHVEDSLATDVLNARVDLVNWPDLFANDTTDANGDASVSGTPTVAGNANITVTGDDLKPFYTTIPISDDSIAPTITVNTASYGVYYEDPGAVIDVDFSNGGSGSDLWFAQYRAGTPGVWFDIFNGTAAVDYTDNWALDWVNVINGDLTVQIRCFDKALNINQTTINYIKDSNPPEIHFNVSEMGWFNSDPAMSIEVQFVNMRIAHNLDRGYYTINDGAEIDIFTGPKKYHEAEITPDWASLIDGVNRINFTVVDTLGVRDRSYANVLYRKDTVLPSVSINNDSYGYYTADPGAVIDVDFYYEKVSLMVNASYRGNDGVWREIFTGNQTGFFTNWSVNFTYLSQGLNDIDIRVYDLADNMHYIANAIQVRKDNMEPEIIINTPDLGWFDSDPGAVADIDFSSGGGSPLVLGQYRIGNNSWNNVFNTTTDEFTSEWQFDYSLLHEGINYMDLRAFDSVNISKVMYKKVRILVDLYNPWVNMSKRVYNYTETYDLIFGGGSLKTFFSNGGSGSMLQRAQYRIDPSDEWQDIFNMSIDEIEYEWEINSSLLGQGMNTIHIRVVDGLFTDTNHTVMTMYYDSQPPVLLINRNSYGWYNSDPGLVVDVDCFENGTGSNLSFLRYRWDEEDEWMYLFQENDTLNGTRNLYTANWSFGFDAMDEGTSTIFMELGDHAGHLAAGEVIFKKDTKGPATIRLSAPIDSRETSAKTLYISWSPVSTETYESDIAYYQYQVADTAAFTHPLIDKNTTELSAEISFSSAGEYHWRVKAVDEAGNEGTWCVPWSFFSNAAPQARISHPSRGYLSFPMEFSANTSSDIDGDINNYTWTIDDTHTLYGAKVEFAFDTHGTHWISLRVRDNLGKTGIEETSIVIERPGFKVGEKVSYEGEERTITDVDWSAEAGTWVYKLDDGGTAREEYLAPYKETKTKAEQLLWDIPWPYLVAIGVVSLVLIIAVILVIVRSRHYSHIFCPKCGEKVARGRGYCPKCNEALFKNKTTYVTSDCPRCSYPVYEWEEKCPECQLPLVDRKKSGKSRYKDVRDDSDFIPSSYGSRYTRHMERERDRWTGSEGKEKRKSTSKRKDRSKKRGEKKRDRGESGGRKRNEKKEEARGRKGQKNAKGRKKKGASTDWEEENEEMGVSFDAYKEGEEETESWDDEHEGADEEDWGWEDGSGGGDEYDDEYYEDDYYDDEDEYYEEDDDYYDDEDSSDYSGRYQSIDDEHDDEYDKYDENEYYEDEDDETEPLGERNDLDRFFDSFGSTTETDDDGYYEDEDDEEEWEW
ncbi:MAG: C25 family cysteine peptidase [Candidatus Thermoplasmatota archaeon]|nr:C25 family cysteine peptidase [Candidatus Thermoplasmatota archaeon]